MDSQDSIPVDAHSKLMIHNNSANQGGAIFFLQIQGIIANSR